MNSIKRKSITLFIVGLMVSSMSYASSDSPPVFIPTVLTVPHNGQVVTLSLNVPGIISGEYYSISCHIMNPYISQETYPSVLQMGVYAVGTPRITVNGKPLVSSQARLVLSDNSYVAAPVAYNSYYGDKSGLTFSNFDDTYDVTVQQCIATPIAS